MPFSTYFNVGNYVTVKYDKYENGYNLNGMKCVVVSVDMHKSPRNAHRLQVVGEGNKQIAKYVTHSDTSEWCPAGAEALLSWEEGEPDAF